MGLGSLALDTISHFPVRFSGLHHSWYARPSAAPGRANGTAVTQEEADGRAAARVPPTALLLQVCPGITAGRPLPTHYPGSRPKDHHWLATA